MARRRPAPSAPGRPARAPDRIAARELSAPELAGLAAAVFASSAALFAWRAAGGTCGGDSGELSAVACALGVAHPPGYPQHTLLASALGFLPLGPSPWRHALASALPMAAATAALAALAAIWSRDRLAALAAAAAFAGAPLVQRWAGCAEVFGLHLALVTGGLALAAVAMRAERPANPEARLPSRSLLAALAVAGLAAAHHQTSIFLLGPPVAAALWRAARVRRGHALVALAVGALAFALPTLSMALASAADPAARWGETHRLSGLVRHLLRQEYGTLQLSAAEASADPGPVLRALGSAMAHALHPLGVLAAAGGWLALAGPRTRPPGSVAALLGLTLYALVFGALGNLDPSDPLLSDVLARFWLAPIALGALGVGLALGSLARWRRGAAHVALAAVVGLALYRSLTPPLDTAPNALLVDGLLAPAPPGGALLTRGDLYSNAVQPVRLCEARRPDLWGSDLEMLTYPFGVDVARRNHPGWSPPGARWHPSAEGGFSFSALIAAMPAARAVGVYPDWRAEDPPDPALGAWVPFGVGRWRVPGAPTEDAAVAARWGAFRAALPVAATYLGAIAGSEWARWPEGTFERRALEETWSARHNQWPPLLAALAPRTDPSERAEVGRVVSDELERLIESHPAVPHFVFRNLAIALDHQRSVDPQAFHRAADALREGVARCPPSDPACEELRQLHDSVRAWMRQQGAPPRP